MWKFINNGRLFSSSLVIVRSVIPANRSSMAAKAESRGREVKLLSARNDQYGGMIVDINGDELMDPATFLSSLTSSIAHWKLQVI